MNGTSMQCDQQHRLMLRARTADEGRMRANAVPVSSNLPISRPALVICHPGHELKLFGWVALARPVVHILTDGSGSSKRPRLKSTERVLESAGVQPGELFGRFSDAELYQRLLQRDAGFFIDLVEELTEILLGLGSSLIVGDAAEGYNSGHDVCRLLVDAAVMRIRQRAGRCIRNRAVALTVPSRNEAGEKIELSADLLQRKLEAARHYAELADEVERFFVLFGPNAFAVETLLPVRCLLSVPGNRPDYEEYGRRQVEAGHYPAVIRYTDHIAPLAAKLRAYVTDTGT
jgi:hypothetical protein